MNEKQVKLLRYFVKSTGQVKMAHAFIIGFDTLSHKKKGKLTTWLKARIVTAMELKKLQKKAVLSHNLDTIKGFV